MNKQEILKELEKNIELLLSKKEDYGSENISAGGEHGVAIRLLDKVHRIMNITGSGGKVNHESLADTWKDITNYGIIGSKVNNGTWESKTQKPQKLVYVAGPIDCIPEGFNHKLIDRVHNMLCEMNFTTFDPHNAYRTHGIIADQVLQTNGGTMRIADAAVFYVPDGVVSVGTIAEIMAWTGINCDYDIYRPSPSNHPQGGTKPYVIITTVPGLHKSLMCRNLNVETLAPTFTTTELHTILATHIC